MIADFCAVTLSTLNNRLVCTPSTRNQLGGTSVTIKLFAFTICMTALTACATPHEANSDHDHGQTHSPAPASELGRASGSDILAATIVPSTNDAPGYIQFANNVEIIEDVSEAMENASSTFTHEGHFGPLLFGESLRAYTLRLEPGMFLSEHPHPTESIVYTLSGRWVLSSEGKRQVMEAGSIFHFGSNMPTGWEAPFAEGAEMLIFKMRREGEDYHSFTDGIRALAKDLDKEYREGEAFYFHQLAPDHPAVLFAREHNPGFDQLVESSRPAGSE